MTKYKKSIVVHLILVFQFLMMYSANGQDNPLSDITIASPTAASLGKYGDIPISYHTGLPQINIPIYTVSEGSLQLPISLSYHASGLKVMEPASWVGAGWSLNAGGVIVRTVVGAPDDRGFGVTSNVTHGHFSNYGFNNYLFVTGPHTGSPPETSDGMVADDQNFVNRIKDGEPDLFTFNFAGYSGKFFFRDDRTPVLVPESDLKIEPYLPGTFYIQGFVITTPDGVKYYFGKNQLSDGNIDAWEVSSPYTVQNGLSNGTAISSWYLNQIVSPDGNFSIRLIYAAENYSYYTISMFPVASNATPGTKEYNLVKNYVQGVRLSKVNVSNGTVNFVPGTTRTDLGSYQYSGIEDSVNTQAKALGAIEITDSNTVCKKYLLKYTYFTDNTSGLPSGLTDVSITTDTKRLRLDTLQEISCDNSLSVPPHLFTYSTPVGNESFAPRRLTFAQDHWGYFNGQTSNYNLIPTYTINDFTTVAGANRESSWPEMNYGNLSKIAYPTGGTTEFVFEQNDIWSEYTYYTEAYETGAGIGPGIGQGTTQTVNLSTNANPYKISLFFHTSIGSNTSGSASFAGLMVDRENPFAEKIIQPGAGSVTYYLTMNNMSGVTNDWANVTINQEIPATYESNKTIGGSRIKQLINNFATGKTDTIFFGYRISGQSTGILYSRPTYVQVMRNDIVQQLGGYSTPGYCNSNGCLSCGPGFVYYKSPVTIRPMGTTQGNHIGYNEVFVTRTGNGYIDYRYYGSDIWDANHGDVSVRNVSNTSCTTSVPNFPAAPFSFEFKRGELKYEGYFNQAGQVIKDITYYPVFTENPVSTPAYLTNAWGITLYNLTTASKTQATTVTNEYQSPGVALTTIDSLFYESLYHHQLKRKVSINSKGQKIESLYKYAFDFRVASCDTISDCYNSYGTSAGGAMSTFNTQLFSCTSGTWNCKWVAFQQYRRDLSIARINYVSCRRSNFTDAVNVFKTNHDAAKTNADGELKPILELQDQFQNPQIQITGWKSGQLSSAIFNKYALTGSAVYISKSQTIFLSALSSTFTSATATTTSITKDSRFADESVSQFTNGNLSDLKLRKEPTTSYLWDYYNSNAIAKVVNGTSTGIAYTSFESNGKGGWTFSGSTSTDATSPTGTKCYNVSGGNITKSSLPNTTYFVSYWGKNGSVSVNSSSPTITGKTIGNWTYYEHQVTGTSITISGNKVIDEVRLYPTGAQMTTYTYLPLIGLVSECDLNNHIQYYEYDKLGRLILTRDEDKNVLKRFEYKYRHTYNND